LGTSHQLLWAPSMKVKQAGGSGGVHIKSDFCRSRAEVNPCTKTGSSATFECLYEPLLNSSTRFWCKQKGRHCVRIIDSTGRVEDTYEGRVAAFENPENKTVTIVLNQLRDKDKGSYWCMSNELREQQSSTELTVVPGKGRGAVPSQGLYLSPGALHFTQTQPPLQSSPRGWGVSPLSSLPVLAQTLTAATLLQEPNQGSPRQHQGGWVCYQKYESLG
uniref:Polymeric immunoglobulin receptor n=1 Tax=Serinus canaria TaxID=9135 RepID=A0A8C9NBS5_SERCA